MSDSLRPRGLQHARPPCPLPAPGTCSNSRPSSWRCHPTISSSVVPFSSCLQSFPASGSFQMSQFFASGGQSIKPPYLWLSFLSFFFFLQKPQETNTQNCLFFLISEVTCIYCRNLKNPAKAQKIKYKENYLFLDTDTFPV